MLIYVHADFFFEKKHPDHDGVVWGSGSQDASAPSYGPFAVRVPLYSPPDLDEELPDLRTIKSRTTLTRFHIAAYMRAE